MSSPLGEVGRRRLAGTCGVLMGAHHGGVHAHRPVLSLGLIASGPQPVQDFLPGAVHRPAAMPVVDGLPVPVAGRQDVGPDPEEHPVDDRPVIGPSAAPSWVDRQQRGQPFPLGIGQVMTIQAIFHRAGIQQSTIHDPPNPVESRGYGCGRPPNRQSWTSMLSYSPARA
jgi:hypothetical protein